MLIRKYFALCQLSPCFSVTYLIYATQHFWHYLGYVLVYFVVSGIFKGTEIYVKCLVYVKALSTKEPESVTLQVE